MRRVGVYKSLSAITLAAAYLLPWAKSGDNVRSGYDLAAVLRASGFVTARWANVLVFAVLMLPLLAATTIVGEIARHTRLASIALVITAATTAACLLLVGVGELGAQVALVVLGLSGAVFLRAALRRPRQAIGAQQPPTR